MWCEECVPSELDEKGNKIMLTALFLKLNSHHLAWIHTLAPHRLHTKLIKHSAFASPGGNANFKLTWSN